MGIFCACIFCWCLFDVRFAIRYPSRSNIDLFYRNTDYRACTRRSDYFPHPHGHLGGCFLCLDLLYSGLYHLRYFRGNLLHHCLVYQKQRKPPYFPSVKQGTVVSRFMIFLAQTHSSAIKQTTGEFT